MQTQTLDVSTANISVEGALEGYNVYVDTTLSETVPLTVEGLKDAVGNVSQTGVTGTVSVDAILAAQGTDVLEPGTYSADVRWNLPDGVKAKGTSSVYVTVEAY